MNKKDLSDLIAAGSVFLGISTVIMGSSYAQEISESYNNIFPHFFHLDKLLAGLMSFYTGLYQIAGGLILGQHLRNEYGKERLTRHLE